mmetsp:Transcript_68413/g.222558  ORF Transcript_68413/g.222558 Transcript_68413/m.222558 type:complete len:225 (+) Transcript_68413:226-900(+)
MPPRPPAVFQRARRRRERELTSPVEELERASAKARASALVSPVPVPWLKQVLPLLPLLTLVPVLLPAAVLMPVPVVPRLRLILVLVLTLMLTVPAVPLPVVVLGVALVPMLQAPPALVLALASAPVRAPLHLSQAARLWPEPQQRPMKLQQPLPPEPPAPVAPASMQQRAAKMLARQVRLWLIQLHRLQLLLVAADRASRGAPPAACELHSSVAFVLCKPASRR